MKATTMYTIFLIGAGVCLVPKTLVLAVTGWLIAFSLVEMVNNYLLVLLISGHNTPTVGFWTDITFTIANLAFNVSHAMLAEKYACAKHRAVMTIEQQVNKLELPKSQQKAYKSLIVLNIVLSVVSGFSYVLLFKYYNYHDKLTTILENTISVCPFILGVLLIVSGVILVTTVIAIRRFYKKRDAADAVDTGALVRHAIAFGLFLVAAVDFNLAIALNNIFPESLPVIYF
jgi:hypothetical protein